MPNEYETRVLDIDVGEIEKKLLSLGATLTEKEVVMKRRVFDIQPYDNEDKGKRLRLRQQGDKTTLAYKERGGTGIGETQELEVRVQDFDVMTEILKKLEWRSMSYRENKRKTYTYNDIEFCMDTWPKIPTYLEIESSNEDKVHEGLSLLDLTGKDVGNIGVIATYKRYGIDLENIQELKFE